MASKCIIWHKSLRRGYGRIIIARKSLNAHKYFYEQKYGKVPQDKVLDHLCRNRACINTDHLEVVSQAENTRRGLSAKLNYSSVNMIRKLYQEKIFTQIQLAKQYMVGQDQISRIVNRRRWA